MFNEIDNTLSVNIMQRTNEFKKKVSYNRMIIWVKKLKFLYSNKNPRVGKNILDQFKHKLNLKSPYNVLPKLFTGRYLRTLLYFIHSTIFKIFRLIFMYFYTIIMRAWSLFTSKLKIIFIWYTIIIIKMKNIIYAVFMVIIQYTVDSNVNY